MSNELNESNEDAVEGGPVEMTETFLDDGGPVAHWLTDGSQVAFDLSGVAPAFFTDPTKVVVDGEIMTLGHQHRLALHRRLDSCINAVIHGKEVENG